jgi:hypothetical protein
MLGEHTDRPVNPMTRPRRTLVRPEATPYYHCINRCVRRAFLCGHDPMTRRSFEHRRRWIVDRVTWLTNTFAIDVCAYAIMSNHYHITVRLDPDRVDRWSDVQVHDRWTRLFNAPPLVRRWYHGAVLDAGEADGVRRTLAVWRQRLSDLSWFMRCLNEYIARRANREDDCTGRFWEGRFKSQALLDEPALLTPMVYVDLNPIRARTAIAPETSNYTSVQARIRRLLAEHAAADPRPPPNSIPLAPLKGELSVTPVLPFDLGEYLRIVDWSARVVQAGKAGSMPADAPPLLARLGIRAAPFADHMLVARRSFHCVVGRADAMRAAAASFGGAFLKGTRAAERMFVSSDCRVPALGCPAG